jgi:hypothetical protein
MILGAVVQLGALIYQVPDQGCAPISRRNHQRRLAVSISRVDVSSLLKQMSDMINIASMNGLFPLRFQSPAPVLSTPIMASRLA